MAAGIPPTRGTWFPRGPRAEVPGSRDRIEGREWGMAADTPPTRGLGFPEVHGLKCLAAETGVKVENGVWLLALPHKGDLVSQRSTG